MQAADWCETVTGGRVTGTLFAGGNLSRVTGLRLDDGREVVVKVRPWEERLPACTTVQRVAADRGYPCPRPLVGPVLVAGQAWSLEEARLGGTQLDPVAPGAAPTYAALLAELVRVCAGHRPASLTPNPPWVGWDTPLSDGIWPARDGAGPAIERFEGPARVDDAAFRAKSLLLGLDLPLVAGHGDFESQNIRWHGQVPYAVHDWDSVVLQPEVAIAGAASSVWAAAGQPGQASTVEQSRKFLTAYQAAAGVSWSETERRAAWAAGIWIRAFNAKKDAADGGGPQLALFMQELDERLAEAGLDQNAPR